MQHHSLDLGFVSVAVRVDPTICKLFPGLPIRPGPPQTFERVSRADPPSHGRHSHSRDDWHGRREASTLLWQGRSRSACRRRLHTAQIYKFPRARGSGILAGARARIPPRRRAGALAERAAEAVETHGAWQATLGHQCGGRQAPLVFFGCLLSQGGQKSRRFKSGRQKGTSSAVPS